MRSWQQHKQIEEHVACQCARNSNSAGWQTDLWASCVGLVDARKAVVESAAMIASVLLRVLR